MFKWGTRLKLIVQLITLMIALVAFAGCANEKEVGINKVADIKDRALTIGVAGDLGNYEPIYKVCPQAKLVFSEHIINIDAVAKGKMDGYVIGKIPAEKYIKSKKLKEVKILADPVYTFNVCLGLAHTDPIPDFEHKVNAAITKLKASGVMEEMNKRWLMDDREDMPVIAKPANPKYTLKVGTYGEFKPYNYLKDNKLHGYDIELAQRLALELNCNLEWSTASYASLLMGLSTGKYDLVSAHLYWSKERASSVLFSEPYRYEYLNLIVRNTDALQEDDWQSFVHKIKDGFTKTFLLEDRWKSFLKGFGVTILITLGGFFLANICGAVFCYLSLSKRKWALSLANIYSRIMQGTPIVVILMILYYVVFGSSQIDGMWVAILGFGLVEGATMAQLFHGGVSGVQKGQSEAALALGFTSWETFKGIVLLQAVRLILPGYFSSLIALLKGTSIVGYIAVVDLTKAGDMVRSSSYEVFFPLLSIALIYFVTASLLISLRQMLENKLAPQRAGSKEATRK